MDDKRRHVIIKVNRDKIDDQGRSKELVSFARMDLGATAEVQYCSGEENHTLFLTFTGDWVERAHPARPRLQAMVLELFPELPRQPPTYYQPSIPRGYGMYMGGNNRNVRIIGGNISNNAAGGIYIESVKGLTVSDTKITDDRKGTPAAQGITVRHMEDSDITSNTITGFTKGIAVDTAIRSSIARNEVMAPNVNPEQFERSLILVRDALQRVIDKDEREMGELRLRQLENAIREGNDGKPQWVNLTTWVVSAGGLITAGTIIWNGLAHLSKALGHELPPAPPGLGQ